MQVLGLCRRAVLVKLGRVALDGTKLKANASRRKTLSDGRMAGELLAEAEATDQAPSPNASRPRARNVAAPRAAKNQ